MEKKTEAIRREILKSLIERYGNKPKKIFIQKAKDAGVYKMYADDDEVYDLAKKFAEFHKMPFGYIEKEVREERIDNLNFEPELEEKIEEPDGFYISLLKEHDTLSKKLLALNKVIEAYKPKD